MEYMSIRGYTIVRTKIYNRQRYIQAYTKINNDIQRHTNMYNDTQRYAIRYTIERAKTGDEDIMQHAVRLSAGDDWCNVFLNSQCAAPFHQNLRFT